MKTAIEWLESEILKLENKHNIPVEVYKLCEKAIAMEKQQIMDAYEKGMHHANTGMFPSEYYDKTFNS